MNLTPEQQAILNGEKGEVLAKVMKTLVMYGDAFGAEKLVPVTSKYGHTVISFGINTMKLRSYYSTTAEGLGFAIPMAVAKPILEELMENYIETRLK